MMRGSSARGGVFPRCVELHSQIAHLRVGIIEALFQLGDLFAESLFLAWAFLAILDNLSDFLLSEGNLEVLQFKRCFDSAKFDLHTYHPFLSVEDLCYVIHLYIIQVKLCIFTIFIMEPNMAP